MKKVSKNNGVRRSPRRSDAIRKPRPVTPSYLRNAAMHYLSGRAASTAMLRQTLARRAKRRLDVKSLDEPTRTLIEQAIADLVSLGMLDDVRFAQTRAASLQRKGLSLKRIGLGLEQKGIDKSTASRAVSAGIDDFAQARLFAQRKKLGPWRRGGLDPAKRQKEIQALIRAGFTFSIAAKTLSEGVE